MHSIIQSPYVFLECRSVTEDYGYVMNTDSPFYLGKVLKFRSSEEYLTSMSNASWPVVPVVGYKILIQFAGSLLNGRRMQLTDPDTSFIQAEITEMAAFYYRERIAPHQAKNKKYLL